MDRSRQYRRLLLPRAPAGRTWRAILGPYFRLVILVPESSVPKALRQFPCPCCDSAMFTDAVEVSNARAAWPVGTPASRSTFVGLNFRY